MFIISEEEFKNNSVSGKKSTEKVYRGKVLTARITFALSNKESALNFYKKLLEKDEKRICILVANENYWQIWQEIENILTEEKDVLESDFIEDCKQLLLEEIGPITSTIFRRILALHHDLDRSQFIDLIAEQMEKIKSSETSKQKILEQLHRLI